MAPEPARARLHRKSFVVSEGSVSGSPALGHLPAPWWPGTFPHRPARTVGSAPGPPCGRPPRGCRDKVPIRVQAVASIQAANGQPPEEQTANHRHRAAPSRPGGQSQTQGRAQPPWPGCGGRLPPTLGKRAGLSRAGGRRWPAVGSEPEPGTQGPGRRRWSPGTRPKPRPAHTDVGRDSPGPTGAGGVGTARPSLPVSLQTQPGPRGSEREACFPLGPQGLPVHHGSS